jgi:uracil phosphoribosyltransferase
VTRLRDAATAPKEFRELVADLARMLFIDATVDLGLKPVTVTTPLARAPGQTIAERIGLFPILRAGLGMANAILDLVPTAHVWHLGLYRDHESLEPVEYYNKLPETVDLDLAVVLDPMLATGGSASVVVEILKKRCVPRIKFLGLIAAPEGVKRMRKEFPDVPLHLAALDSHLNEIGYIVPGLGDAGDRQFAT